MTKTYEVIIEQKGLSCSLLVDGESVFDTLHVKSFRVDFAACEVPTIVITCYAPSLKAYLEKAFVVLESDDSPIVTEDAKPQDS